MRTELVCFPVLKVTSGPWVKLAGRKSALNPHLFLSFLPFILFFLPFQGGGPSVSLTLCCFVIYSSRRFVLCLALCYFVIVF